MYNIILWHVHELLLPWKSKNYYIFVCACVHMWVPSHVGVCMRMHFCSRAYLACKVCAPYCDVICGPCGSASFFDIIS
jgi:hypothetical protein